MMSDRGGGRVAASPHAALRSVVPHGYTGMAASSADPQELVLPATPAISLVIKLRDSARRPPQFLVGAHGLAQRLEGACAPSYLEIWLAPVHAYTILGLPIDRLGPQTVDLLEVLGHRGRLLGERLRDTTSWPARFALVDEFLLGRLQEGPSPSPEVGHAWRRLVATSGAAAIGELAREVGWSHKHLITRFRQQTGLTPKRAAALLRFEWLLAQLTRSRRPDWGRLAAEAGYTDQAHLIRDFHRFAGNTPTDFLARGTAPLRHPTVARAVGAEEPPIPRARG